MHIWPQSFIRNPHELKVFLKKILKLEFIANMELFLFGSHSPHEPDVCLYVTELL